MKSILAIAIAILSNILASIVIATLAASYVPRHEGTLALEKEYRSYSTELLRDIARQRFPHSSGPSDLRDAIRGRGTPVQVVFWVAGLVWFRKLRLTYLMAAFAGIALAWVVGVFDITQITLIGGALLVTYLLIGIVRPLTDT